MPSLASLWSTVHQTELLCPYLQLIKYKTQKPTCQICWIHNQFLFWLQNKILSLLWYPIATLGPLRTVWDNRYAFNFHLTYPRKKRKIIKTFFFPVTLFISFISPLLLYCLCLPAQHFSSIMGHFRQNSTGSTLNVTARCVDLLTMDTEVVIMTLQGSVSWTVLGLDCFFRIWRWKPDEVLEGVINRAGGKTKSAKTTFSSLYFHSCKLWVVECFLAQSQLCLNVLI